MSTNDTEPITPIDALNSVDAISDVAITTIYRLRCVAQGSQHEAGDAVKFRRMGDLLYSYAYTTPADTLWRAADQIDPPTVPAEPDLTTREGWEATMAALGDVEWEDMPIPSCREQRVGLLAAWKVADLNGHDKDAVLLAQVFTASLVDGS